MYFKEDILICASSYFKWETPPGTVKKGYGKLIDGGTTNFTTAEHGGVSEIVVNSNVSDNRLYRCRVYLRNHAFCLSQQILEFERTYDSF